MNIKLHFFNQITLNMYLYEWYVTSNLSVSPKSEKLLYNAGSFTFINY